MVLAAEAAQAEGGFDPARTGRALLHILKRAVRVRGAMSARRSALRGIYTGGKRRQGDCDSADGKGFLRWVQHAANDCQWPFSLRNVSKRPLR